MSDDVYSPPGGWFGIRGPAQYPSVDQETREQLCELLDQVDGTRRLALDARGPSSGLVISLDKLRAEVSHQLPEIRIDVEPRDRCPPRGIHYLQDRLVTLQRRVAMDAGGCGDNEDVTRLRAMVRRLIDRGECGGDS